MTDLIRRLEEAKEGSRELSLEFLRAITGEPWRFCLDGEAVIWDKYGPGESGNPVRSLEDFTTNLHDAASAVPEGYGWQAGSRGVAKVWRLDDVIHPIAGGHHPDQPAIALCIAILRAMEAKNE